MRRYYRQLALAASLVMAITNQSHSQNYAIGADLSFLKSSEDQGFVYKENNKAAKGLDIFKQHGYNWIRLRLFHSPSKLPNNLEYTIQLAREAKQKGFKFLLDYHYSDYWADPQQQTLPKAWQNLDPLQLQDSVYQYTKKTLLEFEKAGVFPNMVQIGNEISNGMMWPTAKLPENWDNFAALLKAGINGVIDASHNNTRPQIMIHIDKGGDVEFTKYFFDKINHYNIPFDIIGQSYYPWWHGSLLDLRECLNFCANNYQKDVILVELAYNFNPAEYIGKLAPFPESPEGQKQFLEEVNRIVMAIPNNRGKGLFWWEPAVGNYPGIGSRSFFDKDGNAQPAIKVFDKYTRH